MAKPPRPVRDYASNLIYRALLGAALALPYRWRVPAMGWLFAGLVAPLAGYRRRVRDNLARAWPDLSPAERRRLAWRVPDNVGRALIEIYSGPAFRDRVKGCAPEGPGVAVLARARAEGTPVLLVTGHFGNYDAPRAWLIANGYRVGGLYSPMRNRFFNAHYVAAIERLGRPLFPRGRAGLGAMLRFLKSGGFVGLVVDQHVPKGERLRFFGRPAMTAISAAEMALKYGALMVPIYGIRNADGLSFRIRVEAPIPPGDPVAMTQALNDNLEAWVRRYPEQWFWIHRRWKVD